VDTAAAFKPFAQDLTRADVRVLAGAFARARSVRPELFLESAFVFAGRPVAIRTVGLRLAQRILRPFDHLRLEPGRATEPALTIELWDERETGVGCDSCRADPDLERADTFRTSADGRLVLHERAQTRTAFDRIDSTIVGWVGDAERLTQYEAGRPLHTALLLWHRDQGMQAVHAGLVARGRDGVLFGGAGGAGKTTTAVTCLAAGFKFLADDYVGLEETRDGRFVGHSLYSSSHFDPAHLKRFPHLLRHALPGSLPIEDKSLVLLADLFPGGFAASATIRAVALPVVRDVAAPRLRPARRSEALLRLAPSSILLLPHAGVSGDGFAKMARLLESLPVYWLELGGEVGAIPERVDELLRIGLAS
jgi:hypothetical protein